MMGFDEDFLGKEYTVKLPIHSLDKHLIINYSRFSVCHNKDRRLALFSASNNRDSRWKIDRRKFRKDRINLKSKYQIGDEFYSSPTIDKSSTDDSNVFDRGHITAKHYVDWGETRDQAEKSSDDSFYFTNCTPQFWQINQDPGAWNKLEAFVMKKLGAKGVSVISGQIFREDDPIAVYKNKKTGKSQEIQIPLKFWKLVYYINGNKLKRIAFVIKQDKEVYNLSFIKKKRFKILETFRADPFDKLPKTLKAFIVDPKEIEKITKLKFQEAEDYFSSGARILKADTESLSQVNYFELSEVDILDYL